MNLKYFITILLLISINQFSFANFEYQKGDSLYVWASSGLNMREGPSTDFPKIKKLEYGDKVEVIDNYLRATPLSLTIVKKSKKSDAFILNGHWVRVKIGTREGYVFDGYLSRLATPRKLKKENQESWVEDFQTYAKREFGIEKHKYDPTYKKTIHDHYIYKNGMEWKRILSECWSVEIELDNLNFQEAYLLFNLLGRFEYYEKKTPKNELEYYEFKIKKKDAQKYELYFADEFHAIQLTFENKKFVIKQWACG